MGTTQVQRAVWLLCRTFDHAAADQAARADRAAAMEHAELAGMPRRHPTYGKRGA